MKKTIKYAKNGALIFGLGNSLLNIVNQVCEMNNDPTKSFDWGRLGKSLFKGAAFGGGGGMFLGGFVDLKNSSIKPKNTDKAISKIVNNVKLDKTSADFIYLNSRAEWICNVLWASYGPKLYSHPCRIGSTEKGTALHESFDIDLGVNFRPGSFPTIADMFFSVSDLLERQIGKMDIVVVREQKKSIAVFFEKNGFEYKIDVVPCRIIPNQDKKGTNGYLYVNRPSFWGNDSSYTKTNFTKLNGVNLNETQKKIVIALKKWKTINNVPLPSHLLQHLVLDAFEYCHRVPKSLTGKIIMVLRHIANNLDVISIRSVENTNNVITNISEKSKREIIDACISTIEEYEYQPNSIIDFFN